jgi:hypothetical protein
MSELATCHPEHLPVSRSLREQVDRTGISLSFSVPKGVSFGDSASLQFHVARDSKTGEPSIETTKWMLNQYPQDIRIWIRDRGGVDKMTMVQLWTLSAAELWAMGYQKCAPEPPPVPMTHKSDAEAERQRKRDEKFAEARRKEEEERERWRKRDEKAAETWRRFNEEKAAESWYRTVKP